MLMLADFYGKVKFLNPSISEKDYYWLIRTEKKIFVCSILKSGIENHVSI